MQDARGRMQDTMRLYLPKRGVTIWRGIATLLGLAVQSLGQMVGWVAWASDPLLLREPQRREAHPSQA